MIGNNHSRRTLLAAASRKTLTNSYSRVGESWQDALWNIYESLGPVHYGVGFKRNAAQKVTYFVAETPDDVDEPIPTENQQVIDAFERLGSFEELSGELVVHINVAGEGYLVGQERDDEEIWDVWSTSEVNAAKANRQRRDDDVETLRPEDVVVRVWRPNPNRHSLPDSSLRSVQAQCEQLLLLNEQIGATAKSRLPAGVLLVPDELSFASSAEEGPDTGGNMDNDPFENELIQLLTTAVQDSGSAARVAPGIIRGAAESLDALRILTFARDMDSTFAAMREELLRMIAAGIDLPPEILLGKADLNHWSSWDVDESAAKLHVDPDVLLVIDSVTRGYLWPALEEGGMGREQAREFQIWRDYSDLTSRPISVDTAIKLREIGTISDEYLRQIANIPEDGAGDGVPLSSPDPATPAGPDNVSRTPPGVTAAAGISLEPLARIDNALTLQIIEASEAAFSRALERAGSIVRAKARKNRDFTAAIADVDNFAVTRHLGHRRVEQLQLTDDQLVPADTFKPLAARLDKLLAQAQAETTEHLQTIVGPILPSPEPEEDRRSAIATFIAALIGFVTARLFNDAPEPDPAESGEFSDSILPGEQVFQLITEAGGGGVVQSFAPTSPRGLALGQRTRSILRDNGYLVTTETWSYGIAQRRTFDPHLALSGQAFESLESPQLLVSPLYSWLGVSHYFPGDHKGCLCSMVPTVEFQE